MKMRFCLTLLTAGTVLAFGLSSCSSGSSGEEVSIDFTQGPQGWTAGFADYPVGQESFFELTADYRALLPPLESMGSALYSSGNNHSDDLFMFWKGKIGGLEPSRTYRINFTVEIATNVPHGCVGIGGAPGEAVTVKAGSSSVEPEAVAVSGTYRMNVDKGAQSSGGADAAALGDIANSQACGEVPRWETKELSGGRTIETTADGEGTLWLFVGTDSGFEGTTSLYFTRVRAILD